MLLNSRAVSWTLTSTELEFDRWPKVMGIVNVTPDSFSDGGKYFSHDAAIKQALKLVDAGADILDVGGESTRPYSSPVEEREELERVIPVIAAIARETDVPISIDTSKAAVAAVAIEAGAQIINDVTGLEGDSEMVRVAVKSDAGICAMHMQGTPQTMQDEPKYQNVTSEVYKYLQQRLQFLVEAGVDAARICLDPGIGFGKTHQHNFELIRNSESFLEIGTPILVGHSRKGFIGNAIGNKHADRDAGTLAISLLLAQKRIHIIRVHDVEATVQGLNVLKSMSIGEKEK